ncbi:MAG: hypothetical protein ACW967_04255, partial [Candidatus Hodarchaeales archaeon]
DLNSSEKYKKLFMDHFINYEKNMQRLIQIRNKKNVYNIDNSIIDGLTNFLNQIIKDSQRKIEIDELDPKEEELVLSLFEQKFSDFQSLKKFDIDAIDWDESLIDRARQQLYSTTPIKRGKDNKKTDSNLQEQTTRPVGIEIKVKKDTDHEININSSLKLETPTPFNAKPSLQPWTFVGKILVKLNGKNFEGIGVLDWPVEDMSGKVFFPVNIEIKIELDQSDMLFREIQSLRVTGISDTSKSRQDRLKEEISDFLNIPSNISLNPTFIKEYLAKRDLTDQPIVFKEKLLRTEYYSFDKISLIPEKDHWAILKDKTKPRHHVNAKNKVPSSIYKLDDSIQRKKLSLWTEETIGTVISQFSQNDNYNLLIEYDFPSKFFLEKLIPKIRGYDPKHEDELWYLRFFVSKKLDGVFEGEALLPQNLWKFLWTEKIPILPFDLRSSFLGIIPSQSIDSIKNSILLKRNQRPNPLIREETFSSSLQVKKNGVILGSVIGYAVDEPKGKLELIYSDLKPADLFKKLGKDSSNIDKLFNRIQRALNLKEDESKTPKAIITYLTFYSAQFATYEDLGQYSVIESWLIRTFSLKRLLYQEIKEFDFENKVIIIE